MNDQEFEQLQNEIENTAHRLEALQRQHIKETGQRYVPNRLMQTDDCPFWRCDRPLMEPPE